MFLYTNSCIEALFESEYFLMCGVGFIADVDRQKNIAPEACDIASRMQNRGDLAAGISYLRHEFLQTLKGEGYVPEVMTPNRINQIDAHSAIVHTRYATSGVRSESYAQPFGHCSADPQKRFVFSFNGNITNFPTLRDSLLSKGVDMGRELDTELLLQLMIRSIQKQTMVNLVQMFTDLEDVLDGAYTIAWLNELGEAGVYRSANGIKPMSYATKGSLVAAASEDSALKGVFDSSEIQPLLPGELLQVSSNTISTHQVREGIKRTCFFEWPYFSSVDSTIDGVSVNDVRFRTGVDLAKRSKLTLDEAVIVPVPDSANSAAMGYSFQSKHKLVTGLTKKIDGGRTFIAHKEKRRTKVRNKYKIHADLMKGENVILLDDSVVRGTTMSILAQQIREKAHPKSLHLQIACPPILAPCYYGIDFPTASELIARKHFNNELQNGTLPPEVLTSIAKELHVDSIEFLPVEAVKHIIDPDNTGLCMACVDGNYPTAEGKRLYSIANK